jgi:membrane-associated phospholipid phosphatase
MNAFDSFGLLFFNQFAFKSAHFNTLLLTLSNSPLFKGVVLVALLWSVWFLPEKEGKNPREIVVTTVASGFIAMFLGRLLAFALPFRLRPIFNPEVHLNFPLAEPPRHLALWSSMPSDHAMLWFAIATGIFLVSRRLGIFALVYTTLLICLPRIYFGLHFPTDVLAGAVLGVGVTLVVNSSAKRRIAAPAVRWSHSHPAAFYLCGFLFSYTMATQFDEIRAIGTLAFHAMRAST